MFENLDVFFRGLILGLMVAAPVGPVGLLCIRRTMRKGLLIGFATGFGAAFADAFFSAVAAFGVAAIMDLIRDYSRQIYIVGGALILFAAWHTWRDAPRQPKLEDAENNGTKAGPSVGGVVKAMGSSFVITLTNPATLFGVLTLVAAFGGLHDSLEASALVLGIFGGSSLWWLLLSGGIALVSRKFTEKHVMWINHIMAVLLAVLAFWAIVTGVWRYLGK